MTTFYVVDDRNPTGYAQVLEEHVSVDNAPVTLDCVYTYGLMLIWQARLVGTSGPDVRGAASFHGYDGHNNVRYLTDSAGNITDTYDYDAFGNLIPRTGDTPNNYLYCGEQSDSDLGLYFLRARYMNPDTGRFWTRDTWEGHHQDPLSLHNYLYCHADPVNRVDPSGHENLTSLNVSMAIRTTLFVLNVGGAINNAKQTARYSVAAFEAISDDAPWNATLSIAGAVMHGGLTAMNVLGLKSFMSSISPPPATGLALEGGGTVAVGRVWRFAFSNPAAKKWIFEEFVPVVGTGLGLFANHMVHEAQWEHRDSQGRIKARGETESGSESTSPGRLDFNEQLQTHTEWKILSELTGLKPGDIITIRGEFPPCNPGGRGCYSVMQEFAKRNQVKII